LGCSTHWARRVLEALDNEQTQRPVALVKAVKEA